MGREKEDTVDTVGGLLQSWYKIEQLKSGTRRESEYHLCYSLSWPVGHEYNKIQPGGKSEKARNTRNGQEVYIFDQAAKFIFSQKHLYSEQEGERVGWWNVRSGGIP